LGTFLPLLFLFPDVGFSGPRADLWMSVVGFFFFSLSSFFSGTRNFQNPFPFPLCFRGGRVAFFFCSSLRSSKGLVLGAFFRDYEERAFGGGGPSFFSCFAFLFPPPRKGGFLLFFPFLCWIESSRGSRRLIVFFDVPPFEG